MLAAKARLQDIDKCWAECKEAEAFLEALPVEGTPQIMVPVTKAAFLPGRLTDTRHCQLRMGEDNKAMPDIRGCFDPCTIQNQLLVSVYINSNLCACSRGV